MDLIDFFSSCKKENKKVGLAFSGGVDSAYLLYALVSSGTQYCAYYVKSEFQPQFEFDDALSLAKKLGARLKILNLSVLEYPEVCENNSRRCYFCKKHIFGAIKKAAEEDGCNILLDGTNASDDISDRPGFAALQEMKVLSPLRDAGLTKNQIRELSEKAGLFTWNKPAYACLATRIKTGIKITKEDLSRTEKAENELFDFGFSDFRIRYDGISAKIQLPKNQIEKFHEKENQIILSLKKYYETISLDMEVTR